MAKEGKKIPNVKNNFLIKPKFQGLLSSQQTHPQLKNKQCTLKQPNKHSMMLLLFQQLVVPLVKLLQSVQSPQQQLLKTKTVRKRFFLLPVAWEIVSFEETVEVSTDVPSYKLGVAIGVPIDSVG